MDILSRQIFENRIATSMYYLKKYENVEYIPEADVWLVGNGYGFQKIMNIRHNIIFDFDFHPVLWIFCMFKGTIEYVPEHNGVKHTFKVAYTHKLERLTRSWFVDLTGKRISPMTLKSPAGIFQEPLFTVNRLCTTQS